MAFFFFFGKKLGLRSIPVLREKGARMFKASAKELRKLPLYKEMGVALAVHGSKERGEESRIVDSSRKKSRKKNQGDTWLCLIAPVTLMIASCQDQDMAFPIAQISFVFAWAARQL